MTIDQLDALEAWIVGIIEREDRAADLYESRRCHVLRGLVEVAFGLAEENNK